MEGFNVIHLSDLHFGNLDPNLKFSIKELSDFTIHTLSEDLWTIADVNKIPLLADSTFLVITGDITAQAKWWQYEAAIDFFDNMQKKLSERFGRDIIQPDHIICIPGNHDIEVPEDIPVDADVNILRRSKYQNFKIFIETITKYSAYAKAFSSNEPFVNALYNTPLDIQFFDLNTTFNLHNYRPKTPGAIPTITDEQLKVLQNVIRMGKRGLRIALMHHPLTVFPVANDKNTKSVYDIRKWLIENGVQVILFGHLHNPEGERIAPIDADTELLCLGTGLSNLRGNSIPDVENCYEILHVDPNELNTTTIYRRLFSWRRGGVLDIRRNNWGGDVDRSEVPYSINGLRTIYDSSDLFKYIGIPPTQDWMVIAHCEKDKFQKSGKHSPGEQVHSTLIDLTGNDNENFLEIIQEKPALHWETYAGTSALFLVDSPHYNPYVKDILKHYGTYLSGGMLTFVDEGGAVPPVRQYIQPDVDAAPLRSDKPNSPDIKLFDAYTDYLLVMRLPSFMPMTGSTNVDVLDVDKNRVVWVISGIHSKASYAGSMLFTRENFIKLCNYLQKKCGHLPGYFEAVFEVPKEPKIVTDFSSLTERHFRRLQLKSETGLSDELPSGVSAIFANGNEQWNRIPIHTVHFDPIAGCNFHCEQCIEQNKRDHKLFFSMNTCLSIFNDLKENNCQHINFYGGEPTLHPNFSNILRMAVNMGFNIFLVTNGSRLNDPKIQRAIIDGRRSIHLRVSLDGHSAETHARNHITSPDYFPEIITSITELIRQDVSVSLSYLLHKNVIPELERACKDWKDRHASAVILRPITGMHGIRPYLDYSPSDKEMIKKVKKENNELVHIHPWFLNALENQDNYLVPKSYPVCYSGFYRIAISPTDGTTMTPVEINDNGKKISMVETDKAWISLCTYQRYEKHFGIAFPDDFSSWVQSGRMEKLREIDPAHDCKDIICCRDLYNQQIAELFQQSA